jgi:hypothetical protein
MIASCSRARNEILDEIFKALADNEGDKGPPYYRFSSAAASPTDSHLRSKG